MYLTWLKSMIINWIRMILIFSERKVFTQKQISVNPHLILAFFMNHTSIVGGSSSGVQPACCYRKVAGSTPLVSMLKCPWARYWTTDCSWCAGRHLFISATAITVWMYVWITVRRFGPTHLLNVKKIYIPFLQSSYHAKLRSSLMSYVSVK